MSEMTRKVDGVTEDGQSYRLETFPNEPHPSRTNCQYAILRSGVRVPFAGHSVLERVEFRERNQLDGGPAHPTAISLNGECRIFFNENQVYRFKYIDMGVAITKLPAVLERLRRFPVPLSSRENIEREFTNRPVYYREMEAIVTEFDGKQGRVKLMPDNLWGRFEAEPWLADTSSPKDHEGEEWVWEDILSPHIWWHRELKSDRPLT
jgi:hypothetical protein